MALVKAHCRRLKAALRGLLGAAASPVWFFFFPLFTQKCLAKLQKPSRPQSRSCRSHRPRQVSRGSGPALGEPLSREPMVGESSSGAAEGSAAGSVLPWGSLSPSLVLGQPGPAELVSLRCNRGTFCLPSYCCAAHCARVKSMSALRLCAWCSIFKGRGYFQRKLWSPKLCFLSLHSGRRCIIYIGMKTHVGRACSA